MGLFDQAAAKTKPAPKKKSKGTTWYAADAKEAERLETAISELIRLQGEVKALQSKMNPHKTLLKKAGEQNYLQQYAAEGVAPESPMKLQNGDGENVTYVVQDRTQQYSPDDDSIAMLQQLFGEDAANDMLFSRTTFGFNPLILSIPGVREAIEKALEEVITEMVDKGTLTAESAGELLSVNQKTVFKPTVLARLAELCGRDVTRMKQLLGIMGSAVTRYIKP